MEAYSLFIKANKQLPEFFSLEPETIKEALNLSDFEVEKLFVCQNIFHNHLAFDSKNIFEKTASVLNDEPSDFVNTQELTPAEVAWTFKVIRMIDPVSKFSSEVLAFAAFVFHQDGLVSFPPHISKETCNQDIPAERFLADFNSGAELSEEAKKIQQTMLQSIEAYCQNRLNNIGQELKALA